MRPFGNQGESATPALLVALFAATLAMVLAIVLLLHGMSDWPVFVAIALLVVLAVVFLMVQLRELDEDEPPGEGDPDARTGDR